MFHVLEPFFCDRLLIRVEADIDPVHREVMSLTVFKCGEIGFKDIDISSALTKGERELLSEAVLEDFLFCLERDEEESA